MLYYVLVFKKKTQLKLENSGEGPFLDVVPGCQFYRLPHKVQSNLSNVLFLFAESDRRTIRVLCSVKHCIV